MEPKLCFLLCETPIIYIQEKVCRCSGSGLTANNQANCGGKETYSAYVEKEFYSEHAHLFNYQVLFTSCELWNKSSFYDTLQVKIEKSSVKSPLNQLEQCAAACLDRNATTESIAFNGDNKQCLCILPKNLTKIFNNTFYLTILSNDSCDHYCDNRLNESNIKNKFKCGSSTESRIWAVYSLNQTCPINSFYIEELKACIYPYSTITGDCPSSTKNYVYNGSVKWDIFLKAIEKLNLTESDVDIDFDDDVTIDASWKCLTERAFDSEDSNYYDSTSYAKNIRSNYVLKNGCLRLRPPPPSYSYNNIRIRNNLCIPNRMNDFSSSSYTGSYRFYDSNFYRFYESIAYETWYTCPSGWLDINKNCYRISENHKTIQKARNRCINFSQNALTNIKVPFISSYRSDDDDYDDDDKNEMMNISTSIMIDTLKGEIVQYTYEWEARLGFYLLDERHDIKINSSFVNEFQMIHRNEENNSRIKDDSCLVVSRTKRDETKNFIIKNTQINNCSESRYVLCKTKPILDLSFKIGCFNKPLTLGLPAMISNHLTYELCLSVCENFKTNLAIINMNKCYCLDVNSLKIHNLRSDHTKFATKDCGNPCSGNQHETCGNPNTIVVLREDGSIDQSRYIQIYEQHEQYLNFAYQNCIDLSSINESRIYKFNFTRMSDVHPRHCVELCAYYKQQYSLLNSNRCLCTNIPMKKMEADLITSYRITTTRRNDNCTQECPANYFYTCGNTNNSNMYSVYYSKLECPFGFQITEDKQRCVYKDFSKNTNSFSTAQSYCKSIGGVLAKINDILEIQDIASHYMLTGYSSKTENYFWIDRPLDIMNEKKTSDRPFERCFQTSNSIDQNCIVFRRGKIVINAELYNQWCFTESDQCSSISGLPICVDRQLEFNLIKLPQKTNDDSSIISLNISTDYSCENDEDYHFIDGHCYKVLFHESTWNDARIQCERDNAILFLPKKSTKLYLIKSLLLRHHSYRTSDIVHVGMFYDNQTRIITQYNITDESILANMSYIYDIDKICKRKVNQQFEEYMSSPILSIFGKDRIKNRQIKCAYINFRSEDKQSISCNAKSCNRLATVICQKAPIVITQTIYAKMDHTNFPTNDPSNRTLKSRASTVTIVSLLVTVLFVLIIIGLIYALRRRYSHEKNNNTHRTDRLNSECTYSKLLIKNESDPN